MVGRRTIVFLIPLFLLPGLPGRTNSGSSAAGQEALWSPERVASAPTLGAEAPTVISRQRARLIQNPNKNDGLPPYALTDQDGEIQRYVEPVDGIDLTPHIGQVVVVRHDTGRTLLASQLEFGAQGAKKRQTADRSVQQAAYQEIAPEPVVPSETIVTEPLPSWTEEEIPPGVDPVFIDGPHGSRFPGHYSGCSECDGDMYCDSCCGGYGGGYGYGYDRGLCGAFFNDCCRPRGCGPGARGLFYVRGEYLSWWFDGMDVPPLAVKGTIMDEMLIADEILFGGSELLDGHRNGGRITAGWYFDDCGIWALEGDYLTFGSVSDSFFIEGPPVIPDNGSADGEMGVGRPFFRVPNGDESLLAIEDVIFINIGGSMSVDITSRFSAAGIRLRHNLCCVDSCCQPSCGDCCGTVGCSDCCGGCQRPGFGTRRIDVTFGLRYADLEEAIAINENLQDVAGDRFIVNDVFGTDNDFYGGELGFVWEWEYRRWRFDLLSRLAIGNTRQRVVVNGNTVITPFGGQPQNFQGGLLTQQGTNIGSRDSDKLTVLPEIGLTLGYQLTCNLHFTLGYSFMYWSSVVRPGDQIDTDVNPNLIPIDNGMNEPAGPFDRPRPFFNQTDFFAHGVNVGLEYRR